MRILALLIAIAMASCAPHAPAEAPRAATAGCAAPDGHEPAIELNGAPLVVLCHALYADPASSAERREALKRWYGESLVALTTFFGASKNEPPIVVSCKTEACELHFSGPTRRSHATMEPRPTVFINGRESLIKGTMVHEMIHIEVARRMAGKSRRALPSWFEEGVATFIGDNGSCPAGTKRAIDDLRRLDAPHAWTGFTNMKGKLDGTYCQARDEIAAWAARRGRPALVEVIDAVVAGRSFDELYGPLVTAIPPEAYDRSLVARFDLDENAGTNAVDGSGRSQIGSLMDGASWTTGHRGAAVKVNEGSYVRADGLLDFGVPDSPFSISLWAKPLANAKVLVHTAKNPSGGDGWCVPLLGHDASGRLVAQVNYGNDEKSFVAAVGPVLALNAWSHVVTTWSAGEGVRLYVNGALVASAVPRSPAERHRTAPAAPVYLLFGSDHRALCWTASVEHGDWNGAIDELRVYDYALTAEQVATDMKGP